MNTRNPNVVYESLAIQMPVGLGKHPLKGPATKTCPFMTHTHTCFTKVSGLLPQKENIQQNSDNYCQVLGGKKNSLTPVAPDKMFSQKMG